MRLSLLMVLTPKIVGMTRSETQRGSEETSMLIPSLAPVDFHSCYDGTLVATVKAIKQRKQGKENVLNSETCSGKK